MTDIVNMAGDVLRTIPARQGDWMQTFTGRQFWPLDPRPEEIDPLDVAHSLGYQCRYGGHTKRFYSVAEHCILMSLWVQEWCHNAEAEGRAPIADEVIRITALAALLHDATEAYVVDVPRPLKRHLEGYFEIEQRVAVSVALRFGLPSWELPSIVHEADNRILMDERAQLLSPPPQRWALELEPLGVGIDCLPPHRAAEAYLARLESLGVAL
jgi:hypothetical protein